MSRADGNFDPIEAVRAFLEEARCDSQIKRTEATIFTVSDASAAVGAPEEEILKSILLRVNHGRSARRTSHSQARKSARNGQASAPEACRRSDIPSSRARCSTRIYSTTAPYGPQPARTTPSSRSRPTSCSV